MTLVVTHPFHSTVADDAGAAAAGEVLPSHWNANHTLTGQASLSQGGTGADLSATGGTGQYVKQASVGGVFTVGTIPASDIVSGTDLTRTNDTNVTLTLGGTPTGALLKATSLTLGWTGTLGLSRGGTAADLSATGGAGQYLKQASLGGAVTVGTIPASDIASGAALTSSNDTNVTITLGGTPASALLKASSITMGWTGTLAASRGGFGADVSASSGVPLFATGVPTFTSTTGSGNFVRATSATLVTPALGTPSSGTLTSCTGLPVGGLASIAANTIVANATGSSASPTAVDISALTAKATPASTDLVLLSDQAASGALKKATVSSLQGAANVNISGTPSANQVAQWTNANTIQGTNVASLLTAGTGISVTGTTTATVATSLSTASNVLGADVTLNNTGSYFDGPSMAQGTSGTWYVSGTVTMQDTAGIASYNAKLWDGTTVIASTAVTSAAANQRASITLSGIITSPAANIRISVNDASSTSGKILFNVSGNSKDASIWGIRIG